MKLKHQKSLLALILIILSLALFFSHYLIFGDLHHIFIYLLGDIAFLPIEVVIVSLIFHKIIEDREKKNVFRKINMLVGVFFSEIGNALLLMLVESDNDIDRIKRHLIITNTWTKKNFENANNLVDKYRADVEDINLELLREFLGKNRDFMLKIIENPTLIEHEFFSELMMALFHLLEELTNRGDLDSLAKNDIAHIENDISRVYSMLLKDWLLYAQHLKNEYPYLFSFTLRTNPFDDNAKVEIS